MTFTDRDKRFLAMYRSYWANPADWTKGPMADGSSSYSRWQSFVNSPTTSLEKLDTVLSKIRAGSRNDNDRASLWTVREAYKRHGGGDHSSGVPGKCSDGMCDGSVFVYVAVWFDDKIGAARVIDPSAGLVAREAYMSTIPCTCELGRKHGTQPRSANGCTYSHRNAHLGEKYCAECTALAATGEGAVEPVSQDVAAWAEEEF